jgi:hypothetical protein
LAEAKFKFGRHQCQVRCDAAAAGPAGNLGLRRPWQGGTGMKGARGPDPSRGNCQQAPAARRRGLRPSLVWWRFRPGQGPLACHGRAGPMLSARLGT